MKHNLFRDNNKTLFKENKNNYFKQGGVSFSTPKIKQDMEKEQLENMLKKKIKGPPPLTGLTSASSSSSL